MASPYKVVEQHLHTEVVYFDEYGTEVGRERMYDDHLYDEGGRESITAEELDEHRGL